MSFSAPTKFILTIAALMLLCGAYFGIRALGDTRFGITLTSNTELERGLVAHFTFDSDSVDSSDQPWGFRSRVGGYVAYATSTLQNNATTTPSQANGYETAEPYLYDEAHDAVYASYGSGTGDQDMYYCRPGSSGDGDGYCEAGEWTKAFDNGQNGSMFTIGMDRINQVIYASEEDSTNGFSLWWCKPAVSGDADGICETGEWTEGWDSATDSPSNVRAVVAAQVFDENNGVFYAGTGYSPNSDGEIFYCRPKISGDADGICEDSPSNEFTKLYDDLTQMIEAGLWDKENSALYWTATDADLDRGGSILGCLPNTAGDADGICEDGEWARVFNDLAHVEGHSITQDIAGGVIYASLDKDIYYCKPNVTGDADGYCENGEWTNAAILVASTSDDALVYDAYAKTLWVGLDDSGGTNSDVYACRPYTDGDADGLCETGEFTLMYNYGTEISRIGAMVLDTTHHVVYWGTKGGTDDGDLFFGAATSSVYSISQTNLTPGSIGQAVSLNGVSDYLEVGNLGAGMKTIAFWVNFSTTSVSQKIINIDGTDQIETNSSRDVVATSFPGTTAIYVDGSSASANIPRVGEWRHVVITDTTGVNASTFEIGRVGATYGGFAIDDVRIYNRTLSAEEVRRLYELGATTRVGTTITTNPDLDRDLLGHWTFDTGYVTAGYGPTVGSGTTTPASHAADTSGAGDNNGLEGTSGSAPTDVTTSNNGYRTDANSGTAWSQDNCTTVFPQSENDQHLFYDFNLPIPAGASISGIRVALEGKAGNTTGVETWCTGLSWDGGASWTSGKESADLIASDRVDTFGGATDTWGRTWSASELSNANFRLMVMPDQDTSQADTYSLDYVGLQVYYNAPGNGIEAVHDRSTGMRTATSSGSSVESVFGVIGQGISLDGMTEQMLRATSTTALSTTLTFAAWFRLDPNTSSNQSFISAYVGDAGRTYYCFRADRDFGPLRLHGVTDDSGSWPDTDVLGSTELQTDTWYHGVFTVNDDELTLYLNGEQEAYEVVAGVSTMNVEGFWLGGSGQSWSYDPLSGALDDVRVYNRVLTASEVRRLYELGATTRVGVTLTTNPELERGLVAHWTFDGKDMVGTTSATDVAGNGHTGTVTGATPAPGTMGQGLYFDGDDVVNVADDDALDNSDALSVAAWVRFTGSTSEQLIAYKNHNASPWYSWKLSVGTTNVIAMQLNDATSESGYRESSVLKPGEWYHIVGTWTKGNHPDMYVNGTLDPNQWNGGDATPPMNTLLNGIGTLGIGSWGYGTHLIRGSLDDVRIYNRALSAEEVRRLYELGK